MTTQNTRERLEKALDELKRCIEFNERGVTCYAYPEHETAREILTTLEATAREEEREANIKRLQEKLRVREYKLVDYAEPCSTKIITIPANYESAFELGRTVTLKDAIAALTPDYPPTNTQV